MLTDADEGMEEKECKAVLRWLGAHGREREALNDQMCQDPFSFFQAHLHLLPVELLQLFERSVTIQQRSALPSIRNRRRHWAIATQPEWLKTRATLEAESSTSAQQETIDSGNRALASSLVSPEEVMQQPRFASLIRRLDEEGADTCDESRYESDDVDTEEDLQDALDAFIRGNLSLSEECYVCDFDDRWAVEERTENQINLFSNKRQNTLRVRDSEDRWFDDEDAN